MFNCKQHNDLKHEIIKDVAFSFHQMLKHDIKEDLRVEHGTEFLRLYFKS